MAIAKKIHKVHHKIFPHPSSYTTVKHLNKGKVKEWRERNPLASNKRQLNPVTR